MQVLLLQFYWVFCSFFSYILSVVVCSVLRSSFQYAKNEHDVRQINAIMVYFELFQQLTKNAGQFWVELEYMIKAFDELNMCKMRVRMAPENQEKLSHFELRYNQIFDYLYAQKMEVTEAEREFSVKLSRLKYIRELGKEYEAVKEKPLCPICQQSHYKRVSENSIHSFNSIHNDTSSIWIWNSLENGI